MRRALAAERCARPSVRIRSAWPMRFQVPTENAFVQRILYLLHAETCKGFAATNQYHLLPKPAPTGKTRSRLVGQAKVPATTGATLAPATAVRIQTPRPA